MNTSSSPDKTERFRFFGAALFLRPSEEQNRTQFINYDVKRLTHEARKNPGQWDCLLMKRNYLDFCWDHIGGNCEANEFPQQTMLREVYEEMGWKVTSHEEVCRQWKNALLQGFIYLVIPDEKKYWEDSPPRVPCEEVQTVRYFNLLHILKSPEFNHNVKGRIQAFLDKQSDFTL